MLGLEGLWTDEDGIRPDLDFIFDGSPRGVRDAKAVSELLATWPRSDASSVEVLLNRN